LGEASSGAGDDSTTLGITNVSRNFKLRNPAYGTAGAPNGSPSWFIRYLKPFSAFARGWTAADADNNDDGAALDDTKSKDLPLWAATPYALNFVENVWPIIGTLFQSGLGARFTDISREAFIRYIARMSEIYCYLYSVKVVNYLAYHYDWSQVFPFTKVVPPNILKLADNWRATEVGMAELWLPLMQRFETKVLFPGIMDEIKRMLTPKLTVGTSPRLLVPLPIGSVPTTAGEDAAAPNVRDYLTYIEDELFDVSNTMKQFLPFPVASATPWDLLPIQMDADWDSGCFNSGFVAVDMFGDTGDPDRRQHLIVDADSITFAANKDVEWVLADNAALLFYTRKPQPTWGEIKRSEIYVLTDYPVLDDQFMLLTPHSWGYADILDDTLSLGANDRVQFTGAYNQSSSANFDRMFEFVAPLNRYAAAMNASSASEAIFDGTGTLDHFRTVVSGDAIARMLRLQVEKDFAVEPMKYINVELAGSSLREIRSSIRAIVQSKTPRG